MERVIQLDMNIQKYISFVKVVELGSFTKAAKVMSYSQSAISRMINDLENEWGIILLERNRAGLRLTSDGLNIYPLAKQLCQQYEAVQRRLEELSGIQTGVIRIGTFSSMATHRLPDLLSEFKKKHPKITFELLLGDYDEIETWIMNGRVDFGFLRLPTLPELEVQFIEEDELMVTLPREHPLTKQKEISFHDLEKLPFILLEKEGNSDVTKLLTHLNVSLNIQATTWDDYAIMAMVEKNLGVSILPRLILQRISYKISIRKLDVPAVRTIGLAYKDKRMLSLASKTFIELCKSL
ncbi:LysR family transcriptional regulator [Enterococcus florum]|uniref:LysR family transcriptional regulator n=1 Tax=Enterococcus florum TaxID=2480627 RepID=A0A4P5P4L5_9ENTE|nr:LysR family transcriptional regulator [Enterococcus florum]GCF92580.1 LysR family transcriptional regulator [Enterococcus florum]